MKKLSKNVKLTLLVVFVTLLVLATIGWIFTSYYVMNMSDQQTVKYSRFWKINNWFDEPIDEDWAPIVQTGIHDYRRTGYVGGLASGMDSRQMEQAIMSSLQVTDGIFIALICLANIGVIVFVSMLVADRAVAKALKSHSLVA